MEPYAKRSLRFNSWILRISVTIAGIEYSPPTTLIRTSGRDWLDGLMAASCPIEKRDVNGKVDWFVADKER